MVRRNAFLLPPSLDKTINLVLAGHSIEESAKQMGVTTKTFKSYLLQAWHKNLRHRPNGHLRRLSADVRKYLWLPEDWRISWRSGTKNLK